MDPIMMQHLAKIRQQEILESARDGGIAYRELVWRLGHSLSSAGQRIMQAAKPTFEEQRFTTQATSDNCY